MTLSGSFRFYDKGVYACEDIGPEEITTHAVLLIGYKQGVGFEFKNSWGSDWGRNGYFWLK